MSNSKDPDETAHYEPSHLDLCCLQKPIIKAYGSERVNKPSECASKFGSICSLTIVIMCCSRQCIVTGADNIVDRSTKSRQEVIVLRPIMPFHQNTLMTTTHQIGACRKQYTICLFVLRFYGPVNPVGSWRVWSVYLTTCLLGRLSPLSG